MRLRAFRVVRSQVHVDQAPPIPVGNLRTQAIDVVVVSVDAHDARTVNRGRSEEHTSELQSRLHLVCRLLLEKKKKKTTHTATQTSKNKQPNSSYSAHPHSRT